MGYPTCTQDGIKPWAGIMPGEPVTSMHRQLHLQKMSEFCPWFRHSCAESAECTWFVTSTGTGAYQTTQHQAEQAAGGTDSCCSRHCVCRCSQP